MAWTVREYVGVASKSRAEAVATVIAPVLESMAKALPVLPPVIDHTTAMSSSPVLSMSTTAVEAVAVSETVPVSSSVTVMATSVTVMVIVSSVLPVSSSTWTVRV